jgi:hypothetical protein
MATSRSRAALDDWLAAANPAPDPGPGVASGAFPFHPPALWGTDAY